MHSPARKPILDGIFWQMPKQLEPSEATDAKTSIRWTITGRADGGIDTYQLELDNGRCWVDRGAALGLRGSRSPSTGSTSCAW